MAGQPVDSQGRVLAHWWKRVVATLIDGVILYVVNLILGALLGGVLTFTEEPAFNPETGQIEGGSGFFATLILGNVIMFAIGVAYYIFFNGSEKGQTPGKMVMKIQVRDEATGGRVSYGKAGLRYLVGAVLFILCFVPGIVDILFPLWDPKRQTIHDKAANTLVIDLNP
ncbi:MAG: RDD family protein [Actinomycetota bacterium]|nr:RDD family protein [Actinomycetota bacterium]